VHVNELRASLLPTTGNMKSWPALFSYKDSPSLSTKLISYACGGTCTHQVVAQDKTGMSGSNG
jgi:hypothetical protein